MSNQNTKRIYFPNLDGLRFLAFFAVFLFHSFFTKSDIIKANPIFSSLYWITRMGDLGVNFFFVLSGFLITFLLLSERQLTGHISIKAFYMRRVLRIWPLYFMAVLFGFVIFPYVKAHFGENSNSNEPAQVWYFLTFLTNFNHLYNGCNTPMLTVLWTVAVEEQFYLVWPLLVSAVSFRHMGWLFSGVILASIVFRFIHAQEIQVLNLHTMSLVGDMAFGAMIAWLCWRDNRLITAVACWPRWTIAAGYLLGIALIYGRDNLISHSSIYLVFDRLIIAIFFSFVLLEQNYAQHSFVKMVQLRFLTYWGTYTYGLYCLHFLALLSAYQIMHRLHLNDNVLGVIVGDNVLGFFIALGMSWVSFTWYEKPFLKFKERFAFITRN